MLTMAIPWSALQAVPWTVGKGARLAFTLLATSCASDGTNCGQAMLVGDSDEPDHWGTLTLQ